MKRFTSTGAATFTGSVATLYEAMAREFGEARAWEFVLAFYAQAGSEDS